MIAPEKLEAVKQWSADPCGAVEAPELEPGSREYFERIEAARYGEYAPWMRAVLPFAEAGGRDVLEVGCGLGTDLLQFARGGARCYAVDLTPEHLRQTARRFELYGERARLARGDAETLPFGDESFDLVYSFGVIHHTPDTEAAVREMHRVLRPGGRICVGVYHRDSAHFWLGHVLHHGLLHGALFRRGWRGLLADIEHRAHSDARPLVKVYTRAGVRRLFRSFRNLSVTAHHLERGHFWLPGLLLPAGAIRRLEPLLGWYLIVRGTK